MKPAIYVLLIIFITSCNSSINDEPVKDSVVNISKKIPAKRTVINPSPVKTYTEIIKSFETTDEFKVSLFETQETFHYLVKFSYKNIYAEDTLKVPNFGVPPSVEIKKGDLRPSCIIGFYDNEKKFRESKLVYFKNNKLAIKVLKHYSIATYRVE